MRSVARWFLVAVLILDVVFAVVFFSGELPVVGAATELGADDGPQQPRDADSSSEWTRDALELLGHELRERQEELERREAELEERMRGAEVLRRAGLPADADGGATESSPEPATPGVTSESFRRLQQAYENMEPDSAAQALAKLAARDEEAVVELLLGWKPRTSGAILDALAQNDPGLAASLSYAIWRRGKEPPAAAASGR